MPKGSALPTANNFNDGDYVFVITDPTDLITTKKMLKTTLFSNVTSIAVNTFVITNKTTPSNSTITISRGKIFYDDDYLYVPTSNNVIKRIALNSF